MEKERINLGKANDFVRNALVFIGYPENIEISVYQRDDGHTIYEARYEKMIVGKNEKFLLPLSTKNYFEMLKYGMELKGFDVTYVDQKTSNNNDIYFSVGFNIASFGGYEKKHKRKH